MKKVRKPKELSTATLRYETLLYGSKPLMMHLSGLKRLKETLVKVKRARKILRKLRKVKEENKNESYLFT